MCSAFFVGRVWVCLLSFTFLLLLRVHCERLLVFLLAQKKQFFFLVPVRSLIFLVIHLRRFCSIFFFVGKLFVFLFCLGSWCRSDACVCVWSKVCCSSSEFCCNRWVLGNQYMENGRKDWRPNSDLNFTCVNFLEHTMLESMACISILTMIEMYCWSRATFECILSRQGHLEYSFFLISFLHVILFVLELLILLVDWIVLCQFCWLGFFLYSCSSFLVRHQLSFPPLNGVCMGVCVCVFFFRHLKKSRLFLKNGFFSLYFFRHLKQKHECVRLAAIYNYLRNSTGLFCFICPLPMSVCVLST